MRGEIPQQPPYPTGNQTSCSAVAAGAPKETVLLQHTLPEIIIEVDHHEILYQDPPTGCFGTLTGGEPGHQTCHQETRQEGPGTNRWLHVPMIPSESVDLPSFSWPFANTGFCCAAKRHGLPAGSGQVHGFSLALRSPGEAPPEQLGDATAGSDHQVSSSKGLNSVPKVVKD